MIRTLLLALLATVPLAAAGRAEDLPVAVSAQVDSLFETAWAPSLKVPTEFADDATFLRRLTLDLTGVIPTAGEVRTFLADKRPDKRARAIRDLSQRPKHATHLATIWRDILLPRNSVEPASTAFEDWLRTKFRQNTPYDQIVRDILTARGSVGQSEPAIYYAALNTKPEELAASSSKAFLGLQVRCAQCHDHPVTQWKQQDFWGFAAFFARVQGPGSAADVTQVDDRTDGDVRHPKTMQVMLPQFLDGNIYSETTSEPRRAVLARWMTSADNPYFAKAAVNRVWWMLFGRGLVNPVDDLGSHNLPSHPGILELLANDLAAHQFDLRRTFEIIASTRAYQLSSIPRPGDDTFDVHYTAMPVRSLSSQQTYDAIIQAAGRRDLVDSQNAEARAERAAFVTQFDAPTRQPTEFQSGIPQALTLLNGPLIARLTDPTTGDLIAALSDSPFLSDEQRVETLFLATLSRLPDRNERMMTVERIRAQRTPGEKAQTLGDILWALLNSGEFVLNR